MNEMLTSDPYAERLNQGALEKQREKYIHQEISWLLSDEGLQRLKNIKHINEEGSEEDEAPDKADLMYEIVAEIRNRLWEKNPGAKNEEEYEKFKVEFPEEIIRQQLIREGIFNANNELTIFSSQEEE